MRVGLEVTSIQPHRSGVGVYTENLLRSLAADPRAPDLRLFSNRTIPHLPDEVETDVQIQPGPRIPFRALWMQSCLPKLLRDSQVDLCHFPNYLSPVYTSCPSVVTFHDMSLFRYPQFFTWKKRYLSRTLIPRIARNAAAIIAVSEFSRREVIDVLDISPKKVHVTYEAPPPNFRPVTSSVEMCAVRKRYNLPERFVLSVGNIEPRKNLDRLLAAYEQFTGRASFADVGIVIVGTKGWKYDAVASRMLMLQRRGQLLHLGYVPDADLPSIYSMAGVLAYPSLYEGFGLPVLEAMACRAPVLTSNRSATQEVSRGAAIEVDPEDTEAIRKGLEQILASKTLAEDLRGRGVERAKDFTWQKTAEQTCEVYAQALRCRMQEATRRSVFGGVRRPRTRGRSSAGDAR